jgi:hypothetical protein
VAEENCPKNDCKAYEEDHEEAEKNILRTVQALSFLTCEEI